MITEAPETALVARAPADLAKPLPPFVRAAGAEAEAFTVEFFAVKTGILGSSRSAVSGRNRFYRPFDPIKFRALNALSPRRGTH